jgi:cellulose synthase/poly-beta-1,6-N-acetylglucosamine synthase-like glycosyltransferase
MTPEPQPSPVSVVLACHTEERWASLVRAIESAAGQRPAPAAVIVAVDHNPALSARLRAELPHVVVVDNGDGVRGASPTRNAGAALVTTPLLAFLDDDATAREGWLVRLIAPFADPDVIGIGGGVDGVWAAGQPAWFPDEFGWVVGASYTGMPERTGPIRNVWSENMAVRRVAFEAVGGFSVDFGKVGSTSRPEDTDLCIRMAAGTPGAGWIYVPDARVDHEVPSGRSTLRFFLRRSFCEGRGKVELSRKLAGDRDLGSERDYLRRTLPAGVVRRVAAGLRHRRGRDLAQAASIVAGTLAAAAGGAVSLVARGS